MGRQLCKGNNGTTLESYLVPRVLAGAHLGSVMHMLESPGELLGLMPVAGDRDLQGLLVKAATTCGGGSHTQQVLARSNLCLWSKAFLKGVVVMVLDINQMGAISLTHLLGRCIIMILAFSSIEFDRLVARLASSNIEETLAVEGLGRPAGGCSTHRVNLVTDGRVGAIFWYSVWASIEARPGLSQLILLRNPDIMVITIIFSDLVPGSHLCACATFAGLVVTFAEWSPLVKDWLSL